MAFMDTIGPYIDKTTGQLSSAADMTELSRFMQELTSVHDKTMCLMLIQRSKDMAPRLAAPLWPLLDTWLAEAKDTNNSTMLKNLLGVLIMLPVSFALLVGGRQIPKVVRKLAKKWPKEDVREMAAGLFKRYTAIIAENTDGEVGTVVSKSQPTSPRSDSDRKFVNSFNDEAVVEEWENEWKIYKAIDDETPSQIAKKKNVSLNDLLKINVWRLEGLKAGSPLEAGTDILVPINGPNDPKKKAKKRVRAASASEEASSRANLKRVRSSSESTATPAASRRPVATSPPARTPSVAVVKSPTALPSQKKVAKQAVPQIRKLSSSGRSGSFGAALAKAKVVRAPPKKSIPLTKVVKPHAKAKVTPSISSTAAAKQPQLKSTNGSSKAKARQDPSKVIAVENTAAKQGMPVDRTPSAGGGPALVARMLGKGPASNSKKTPATSRSKVSIVEPPRRRVYFPGQGATKVYPGESDSKPLDASRLVKIKYIPTRANMAEFSPVRSADHQREQAHNEFQRAQEQTMRLQKQRQPTPQIAWSTPVPIDLKSIGRVFGGWDSVVRRKHAAYTGLAAEGLKENVLKSVAHQGVALDAHPCRCGEQAHREKTVAPFLLLPGARPPDNPAEPDTRQDRGELVDPYHIVPLIPLNDTQKVPEAVAVPAPAPAPAPALAPDASEIDIFANIDQLIADASNAGPVVPSYQQPAPAPAPAYAQGGDGVYGYDHTPANDRYEQHGPGPGLHGPGPGSSDSSGYATSSQPQQRYDRGHSGAYNNHSNTATAPRYENYASSSHGGAQQRRRNLPPQMLPCSYFNTPNGCSNGSSCKFNHARR